MRSSVGDGFRGCVILIILIEGGESTIDMKGGAGIGVGLLSSAGCHSNPRSR
jgi:hypothetical protein